MQKPTVSHSVALRVQGRSFPDQIIILARLAESRVAGKVFTARELDTIFVSASLPRPKNISDVLAKIRDRDLITNVPGGWNLTPLGRQKSLELVSDLDLAAFSSEMMQGASTLGKVVHTLVP